jgi:ribosomal protein L40E
MALDMPVENARNRCIPMAEAAPDYQQHEEYWKPLPALKLHSGSATELAKVRCGRCGAELTLRAKYCHACGFEQTLTPIKGPVLLTQPDLASVVATLQQNLASFIALVMGCTCLLAAAGTGFLFKANTLSDWQAVQLWRIEWLLGAIALFAAGVLLKRFPQKP